MVVASVTQKTEIYHTLYQLSLAFAAIEGNCDKLRQCGMLKPKFAQLYQAFAQELQGELHSEVLLTLQSMEEDAWARSGKIRNKWEKYLQGPQPKSRRQK